MYRLGEFKVIKLQPLDESHQRAMIAGLISPEHGYSPEQVETFRKQLSLTTQHHPEMASSPFLLSLMIEVFKDHGSLPSERIKLYGMQVEGIVRRCMKTKGREQPIETAYEYLESLACVCQMQLQSRKWK